MTTSTTASTQIAGWTQPPTPNGHPTPRVTGPTTYSAGIDQVRYWVGSAITAAAAALAGVIGLVIAHGIVHVPVMFGTGSALSPVHATLYGLAAAAIALGASALFDAMLHVAPRPVGYFSWLVVLVTALAVLLPFTTTAVLSSQIAFAAMNLAVGLIILILVPMAAVNARR